MDRVVLRVGGSILILTVSALGTVGQSVPRERVSKTAACTAALEKGKHLIVEHSLREAQQVLVEAAGSCPDAPELLNALGDRKSTRLNSSHLVISYAVFCLKKKKQIDEIYMFYI